VKLHRRRDFRVKELDVSKSLDITQYKLSPYYAKNQPNCKNDTNYDVVLNTITSHKQ